MEIFLGIGILVFLAAVIVVVLLGPSGDGLRGEPAFTGSFASSGLIGSIARRPNETAHSGCTVKGLTMPAEHIEASTGWSDGLAGSVDLRPQLDPVEFHHTNNFTL